MQWHCQIVASLLVDSHLSLTSSSSPYSKIAGILIISLYKEVPRRRRAKPKSCDEGRERSERGRARSEATSERY